MPGQSFYEATAQLIPLLWITLLVEHRLLHRGFRTGHKFVDAVVAHFMSAVAISFVVAEASVLETLRTARPSGSATASVYVALILGAGGLMGPLIPRALTAGEEAGGWKAVAAPVVAFAAYAAVAVALVALVLLL